MKKLYLALLTAMCAMFVCAESFIGLSTNGTVEVFDETGALTASYNLTIVSAEHYVNVTYGDFLASNAGNELAVLRDQGTVEYYAIDGLESGSSLSAGNRLASNDLKDTAGSRTPLSITSAGNNLMSLSHKTNTSWYAYTYVPTNGFGTDIERNTFGSLSLGHDPYKSMSAGNFSSDGGLFSLVTVAQDNSLETFVWDGETDAVTALTRTGYKGIGSSTGTIGMDAFITASGQIAMLNTNNTLYFFNYDGALASHLSITYTGTTIALASASELKAVSGTTLTIAPATEGYAGWLVEYGLSGEDAAEDADPDGDGQINLYEYGLGGDPTDGSDIGTAPSFQMLNSQVEYVYVRLTDPESGLSYDLELTEDLTLSWTNIGYTVTGTNDLGTGFEEITNTIPVDVNQKFIHLLIEQL